MVEHVAMLSTAAGVLLIMMRLTAFEMLFLLVLSHQVELGSSFSLEMASRRRRAVSKTNRRASAASASISNNRQVTITKTPHQKKEPASIGEAIQQAETAEELLTVAKSLWLPTDQNLAPHFKTQRVHHEKRQRWSSQLLHKLASLGNLNSIIDWQDDGLARAVLAAALPFDDDDRPTTKEGRQLRESLWGLHALAGKTRLVTTQAIHSDIYKGISIMIERVEGMAHDVSLQEAVEVRWAIRGLLTRIGMNPILNTNNSGPITLEEALPNLECRVSALPFDIIPLAVDWSDVLGDLPDDKVASTLRDAIPFQFDTIVTRTGSSVTERRGTAWVTEQGIGALAYSGKLMPPHPIPNVVRETMRLVEQNTMNDGAYFDCALCNHYPDGEAACKFHTDPEHGSVWERLTCVVAAGEERRFAFRPIPGTSTWSEWDTVPDKNMEETIPAVIHLFPGDVVKMWGACNDDFHHAVYRTEGETVSDCDGRVSLVLKRAISRRGGKRGHGLEGEGRRSRKWSYTGSD